MWVIANACFGLALWEKKNVHEVWEKIAKTSVLYPKLAQFFLMAVTSVLFSDWKTSKNLIKKLVLQKKKVFFTYVIRYL